MEKRRFAFPGLIYGGDYNPDQWLRYPDVLKEDLRLMKLAGCNAMTIGIFSWSALEPREGEFRFGWLDSVIGALHDEGISVILATPSGARPAWMARKYPEVLRVTREGVRRRFGERHNHCYTSPVYREKVGIVNGLLSERYGRHPAVILWHLSNEYGGECCCPLCTDAFRTWLRGRYGDLDALNHAWWADFWSHAYSAWDEIDPPSRIGDSTNLSLNLDWKRFVTSRTLDFIRFEAATVRAGSPEIPVTTNFMGTYDGLDYGEIAPALDIVSWDSYPRWHRTEPDPVASGTVGGDAGVAAETAFLHDLNRSFLDAPFLLMESTPSVTNWQPVSKLKRSGMNELSSIQAVAHGSDSVQYFQWRKSRGGAEKFHGAVVDHDGTENTRVFREVSRLGEKLRELSDVAGSSVVAETAVYFDWENWWAVENAHGPRNDGPKGYREDCLSHYCRLWRRSIPADVIDRHADFSKYRLVVAPMLYMVRGETASRIEEFVRSGGHFVTTYWSGIVNETDLCHLGGFPGPLRTVLGIPVEEIDALYPEEKRTFTMLSGNPLGFGGTFALGLLWESVRAEGAQPVARFDGDVFAGMPAATVNRFGGGYAWYLASRNEGRFLDAFYDSIAGLAGISGVWPEPLPEGMSATRRSGKNGDFLFVMNFTGGAMEIGLPGSLAGATVVVGRRDGSRLSFEPWGYAVLRLA